MLFIGALVEGRRDISRWAEMSKPVSLNTLVLPDAVPANVMESSNFPDINIKGKKPQEFQQNPNLYKWLTYEGLQQQNWKNQVRTRSKGNSEERNRKNKEERHKKGSNKVRWKLGEFCKEEG